MSASLPINRRYLALAVGVLLIAAAMRLIGAADAPFWSDEAWNLWVIQTDFPNIITRLAANHHPPAYFLTLEAWRSVAGESKIALSFVAIAAGMLTCALVIRLGREGIGVFGALAAGLIFATFEQTVYYGQSIRHYSFLLLGAALTLWLFVRLLRRPTWPRAIAYGLAVAFTAYSLYIGAVLVAVQALIGLIVWRKSPRDLLKLAGAYALALVVFIPWLIIGISGALSKIQRGAITGYINSIPSTPDGVLSMLDIILGGQSALGVSLILVLISLGWRMQRIPALFAAQFLVAFALMALTNVWLGIVSERTLAMFAPAAALTLAAGLALIQRPARGWLLTGLVAWVILTPQGILPRLNSDLVAQHVAAGYSPGDLVLLETGFDDAAFGYQLEATLDPLDRRIFRSYYEYDFPDDDSMMAALDAEIAASDRIWLVYWNVPPRMAEKLSQLGYVRLSRADLPVGSGDPLYELDPIVRVTLWARPPADSAGLIFGDSLRLDGVTLADRLPAGAESLYADVWWTPVQPVPLDYTVGLFLLDSAGVTRAEGFGPAPDQPMTSWPVGESVVVRQRLDLPPDLPAGEYALLAVVYWYQTPDAPLSVNGDTRAVVGSVRVE